MMPKTDDGSESLGGEERDGSSEKVDHSRMLEPRGPELDPCNPLKGRRKLTPQNCPLTATCVLWHANSQAKTRLYFF